MSTTTLEAPGSVQGFGDVGYFTLEDGKVRVATPDEVVEMRARLRAAMFAMGLDATEARSIAKQVLSPPPSREVEEMADLLDRDIKARQ